MSRMVLTDIFKEEVKMLISNFEPNLIFHLSYHHNTSLFHTHLIFSLSIHKFPCSNHITGEVDLTTFPSKLSLMETLFTYNKKHNELIL